MIKNCPKCHTEFDDFSKWGAKKFCSRKCANSRVQTPEANEKRSKKLSGRSLSDEHIQKISGANNPKWKGGGKQDKHCVHCDKLFTTRSNKQKFCSQDCWKESEELIRSDWHNYRLACQFKFNVYDYPDYFDLGLLEEHGWYSAANRGNNLTGISRDHMISVKEGFRNDIDPAIISHPANCELMLQNDNSSKKTQSSITLSELLDRIENFDLLAERQMH